MRVFALAALCALVLTQIAAAGSRACGDDVDGRGRAVPCDCGDVLVSSHTLGEADPITHRPCATAGLVVKLPADHSAVTLNLAGQTLSGSGRGIGVHVINGRAGELLLSGPGVIRGFDVGVFAPYGTLTRAEDVTAADNVSDGFVIGGTGYAVVRCTAERNGRDGFVLNGVGFALDGNRALQNSRFGFMIGGHDATLGGDHSKNEATGNGHAGILLRGRGHLLQHAEAVANGRGGVVARFSRGRLVGVVANHNRGGGLEAVGRDLVVTESVAADNGGPGIDVRGARVKDGGGNRARGNAPSAGTRATARRSRPSAECRVGAVCR